MECIHREKKKIDRNQCLQQGWAFTAVSQLPGTSSPQSRSQNSRDLSIAAAVSFSFSCSSLERKKRWRKPKPTAAVGALRLGEMISQGDTADEALLQPSLVCSSLSVFSRPAACSIAHSQLAIRRIADGEMEGKGACGGGGTYHAFGAGRVVDPDPVLAVEGEEVLAAEPVES